MAGGQQFGVPRRVAKVIRCHQFDGFAPQQPHVAQPAIIGEHGAESGVVHRRADQPAAAGFKNRRALHVQQRNVGPVFRVFRKRFGDAGVIFLRHRECGVGHTEGTQYARRKKFAQRLAGNDFHQPAQHVGGTRIFPVRTGLMQQRQRPQRRDVIGVGLLQAGNTGLDIGLVHRPIATKFVCQAGRMAQKILHRDRAFGGHGTHHRRRERGNILANGVGQQQPAFFPQHHDRDRYDGFGHRIDAENGVLRHRCAARRQRTKRLMVGDFAMTGDQSHRTGHVTGRRTTLQRGRQTIQSNGG